MIVLKNSNLILFEFNYKNEYPSLTYDEINFDLENHKLEDVINLRTDFISKGRSILRIDHDEPEEMCNKFKILGNFFGKNLVRDATRRSSDKKSNKQVSMNTVDSGKFVGPHQKLLSAQPDQV